MPRFLVGGPSNSGKSTLLLSTVAHLRRDRRITAESIEFDVWSNSYTAFRGEVAFAERPKRFGLDWDWKTPLLRRIREFEVSTADIVFGDLPGILDEAIDHMCRTVRADGGIIVSRTDEGLAEWAEVFRRHGIPISARCKTYLDEPPLIVSRMDRRIVPGRNDVDRFTAAIMGAAIPRSDAPDESG